MELLVEPNNTQCFRMQAWTTTTLCRIILQDENCKSVLFENRRRIYVNHCLCKYLLKKLRLENFLTPNQFLIALCEIAFNTNFEILWVETLNEQDSPVRTFEVQRTLFEVPSFQFACSNFLRGNFFHIFEEIVPRKEIILSIHSTDA